ncbi:type II toxin-antitoxin system VapC family toxin [Nocardioides sp. WS12]|uniref:type II toxin-antitoxin system VapC family toxin n=1 Tax=Nocardioides sp. WS12 TaxID=2486272 RepID=UPI0015FA23A0|nr:type II toxin-antitoxin system VapC family toxin [Nocardioides sp. WS12]
MTVVVDTSVLIDHLRGKSEARVALSALVESGEAMVGTVLTRTEILAGMRSSEEAGTLALLDTFEWVPVTVDIADRAGRFAQTYLRSHAGVDTVDYVIAATVEAVGGRLWTRNVKHFPMFDGLAAPY